MEPRPPLPRPLVNCAGLAFLALLLAAIGMQLQRPLPRAGGPVVSHLAQLAPPPWVPIEVRTEGRWERMDFASAMSGYVLGDWDRALTALDDVLAEEPDHGPARFYRGIVRQALDDRDGAGLDYARVATEQQGFLHEHALWRLAQLRLLADKADEARLVLHLLAREEGAFAPNAWDQLTALAELVPDRSRPPPPEPKPNEPAPEPPPDSEGAG